MDSNDTRFTTKMDGEGRLKRRALPSSIDILGRKVKVKQERRPTINGEPVCGYFDRDRKLIVVDLEQDDDLFWETFAHEIEHAIHWRVGLWQERGFQNMHEMLAETAGNAWGPILRQLIAIHAPRRKRR